METRELEDFWRKVCTGRAIIDGRAYLRTLTSDLIESQLPAIFGLKWKKNPSVHLVKGEVDENAWNSLPRAIREHLKLLTNPKSEITTTCLNKIKHGPQVVLSSPRAAWIERGRPGKGGDEEDLPGDQMIRILTQGARTQESDAEVREEVRAAPFILDDPYNAYRWLNGPVMDFAMFFFMFGRWLLKQKFPERPLLDSPSDPALRALFASNLADLERRGGTDDL